MNNDNNKMKIKELPNKWYFWAAIGLKLLIILYNIPTTNYYILKDPMILLGFLIMEIITIGFFIIVFYLIDKLIKFIMKQFKK